MGNPTKKHQWFSTSRNQWFETSKNQLLKCNSYNLFDKETNFWEAKSQFGQESILHKIQFNQESNFKIYSLNKNQCWKDSVKKIEREVILNKYQF